MTGVAEMFLYDTNDYTRPNDRAVQVARGMVGVMRLLDDAVSERRTSRPWCTIADGQEVNDLGVFIYV